MVNYFSFGWTVFIVRFRTVKPQKNTWILGCKQNTYDTWKKCWKRVAECNDMGVANYIIWLPFFKASRPLEHWYVTKGDQGLFQGLLSDQLTIECGTNHVWRVDVASTSGHWRFKKWQLWWSLSAPLSQWIGLRENHGKSTGIHRFSHEIWRLSCIFSLKPIQWLSPKY